MAPEFIKGPLKKKHIAIIVVAIVGVALAAHFIYEHLTYVSTDNAQISARVSMLSSRVSGIAKEVRVIENQKVKAGELLAEVDPTDYETALATAESALASAEAKAHESDLNFRRTSDLFAKQAVTKERFDTAQASYRENGAKLKGAQAQAKQARTNLDYTRIVAPADGMIARKSVEVGQFVPTGQAVFGFVFAGERWITANLKETELSDVRVGQKVSVDVDALPGETFQGEVESINPSVGATFSLLPPDNATGNFTKVVQRVPVRIKFVNLKEGDLDRLQAGLSVEVKIRTR